MGEFMRKAYDWSQDVRQLTMPVLLVYAGSDMFRPEHIVEFYQLLGGLRGAGWMGHTIPVFLENRGSRVPGSRFSDPPDSRGEPTASPLPR
jgi:hypothetical protein